MRKSQKKDLLERFDLIEIQKTWVKFGMYEGARILGNSNPFVLFHLAKEMKWKRQIPPHLLKAVQSKCWEISNSHYILEEEVKNV